MKIQWALLFSVCATLLPASVRAAEDQLLRTRQGAVEVEIFIPKESRPVQGLLVHVFNYKMKTDDRAATLCRELKWAHINTIISRKENNRPAKIRHAIDSALKEFAEKTGLPELVHVPRTGIGFSAGGMVVKVLKEEPDLMLTNAISCSWISDPAELGEAAAVPELFIIGAEPDGFKMLPAIERFYEPAIAQNRPWLLGLQHGCKHDWANSGTLANQWIQSVARLRYPDHVDVSKPIPLRPVRFEQGWRGDRTSINSTWARVAPATEYEGDPKTTVWLPDRATAYVWRAWQTKNSPADLTARSKDGTKKLPAFEPRKSFGLAVLPGTDMVLGVAPKEQQSIQKVRYYHGDTVIGEASAAPWEVSWKAPPIGTYAVWAECITPGGPAATNPALICFEPNAAKSEIEAHE